MSSLPAHRRAAGGSAASVVVAIVTLLIVAAATRVASACACGCGVFEVGTAAMLPQGAGGIGFIEYDFQDQTRNWHGASPAPAADNPDRDIRTHFVTAGLQYMFDRSWGVEFEVPYVVRHFRTIGGASGDDAVSLNYSELGDVRVKGIYTGFFDDLSAGVTFGFKLPTGDYTTNDSFGSIDRDSEIGTGSTDLLLGGFYRGNVTSGLSWFAQAQLDLPVMTRNGYRPGLEVDAAAGIYPSAWTVGGARITPLAQLVVSERTRDTGYAAADPVASGYQRLLISPGVEVALHPFMLYVDVGVPIYERVTGNQLVAPVLFKAIVSYSF